MPAQYTQISFEDMQRFIGRAFHALKPSISSIRGEQVIDLALNDNKTLGVRVWTSIASGATMGAALGEDAIRVQFYNFKKNHPCLSGKAPIVKRTQNWRDNLRERIEDVIEEYTDKEEYWESRAS